MSVDLQHLALSLVPFVITVVIYFIFYDTVTPSIFQCILKCAPILSLIYFVTTQNRCINRYAYPVVVGLAFSAVGDACLVGRDFGYFVPGIIAFGVAHMMYVKAFGFKTRRVIYLIPILIVALLLNVYVFAYLHGLFCVLGPLYTVLICTMVWRAVDHCSSVSFTYYARLIGAIFFFLSDSFLAVDNFVFPSSMLSSFIMPTYYAGQLGIALSTISFPLSK